MGIRIDALDAAASVQSDHAFPAMRSGATVKLTADQIATFVIALVTDSAPATLDTLNELAAALGDDPNFATTVTNALAAKASLTGSETLTNKTLTAPVINSPVGEFIRRHISGLTLSNNAGDATNDIDIAPGSAGSNETTPRFMVLASALTKRLDANWSAGSGNGMRWSGEAIANKTYHLFLGTKADGSDGEAFAYPGTAGTDADSAAFAATVLAAWQAEPGGSSYVRVSRIGSIIRSGGAILGFRQTDNLFELNVRPTVSSTNPGTSRNGIALTVPAGVRVRAQLVIGFASTTTSAEYCAIVRDPLLPDLAPDNSNCDMLLQTLSTAGVYRSAVSMQSLTNTSAQTFARCSASDAGTTLKVTTTGWIDTRGR